MHRPVMMAASQRVSNRFGIEWFYRDWTRNMRRNFGLWQAITITAIVFLLLGFFFIRSYNSHRLLMNQKAVQEAGKQIEKEGIMTVADHDRLTSIHDGVEKTGNISSEDFKWLIALLQSKPLKDTQSSRDMKPASVMLYMGHLKNLSSAQKQELYTALLPYLNGNSVPLTRMAMRILGDAKVGSAKPVLTQLLHDNSKGVREGAKKALQKIDFQK